MVVYAITRCLKVVKEMFDVENVEEIRKKRNRR